MQAVTILPLCFGVDRRGLNKLLRLIKLICGAIVVELKVVVAAPVRIALLLC